MEKLMEELIETVAALGKTTFWDFAPVLLSAVAVFVAIYVPSRIAKKQNQIAVFDKLYTAYSQFLLVKSFAASIRTYTFTGAQNEVLKNRDLFCVHFETTFGYRPNLQDYTACTMSIGTATSVLRRSETEMYMLPMLMSKTVEQKQVCADKILAIYQPLFLLTTDMILLEPDIAAEADQYLKDFVAATDAFFAEYAEAIEVELMCRKK